MSFYLGREGTFLGEQAFRDARLLTFQLDAQPQFAAVGQQVALVATFPPDLTLIEARWGAAAPNPDRNSPAVAAGTQLWAILTWRLARPLRDVRVSVDLVDDAGHRLESSEMSLADGQQATRSTVSVNQETIFKTYHLLAIPPTQPAGPGQLAVRVYNARTLEPLPMGKGEHKLSVTLGVATVTPPLALVDVATLQIARPHSHVFASGVELLGTDPWLPTANAGQILPLRFYWRVTRTQPTPPKFNVRLGDTAVSAVVVISATMPGQIVHTYADLPIPPDLPAGGYDLRLVSAVNDTTVMLGSIAVANRPRQFAAPTLDVPYEATFGETVRLLGLNIAAAAARDQAGQAVIAVAVGQPITLTLVWRVLDTPKRDLTRFIHVLGPDGRPVAQVDGAPCGGECPAMSWLAGEVLVEQARLVIPADLAAGDYPLAIGWYDARTFQRLPVKGNVPSVQAPIADATMPPIKFAVPR